MMCARTLWIYFMAGLPSIAPVRTLSVRKTRCGGVTLSMVPPSLAPPSLA